MSKTESHPRDAVAPSQLQHAARRAHSPPSLCVSFAGPRHRPRGAGGPDAIAARSRRRAVQRETPQVKMAAHHSRVNTPDSSDQDHYQVPIELADAS